MKKKKPSIKTLKAKLWKLTSEYVRRRHADDAGFVSCYTCGKVKPWREVDAGHAIPGRHNLVLFDTSIIRAQCKHCNGAKSGMQYEFGKRLNEENGEGWFEKKLAESHGTKKFYESDYLEMIEEMKEKLDELP